MSSRLWGLLQGHHLKCAVDPLNAAQLAQALSRAHTLGIIGKHMTDCDTDALLKDLHKVSTLTHFRFSLWCRTNHVPHATVSEQGVPRCGRLSGPSARGN